MADTAGSGPSRRARAIAVTVLCLLLVARLADAASSPADGQVGFVVALLVVPMLYALYTPHPLLARYRWPLLAVQAALTFVPFAVFGGRWEVGVSGLLAGLVLLTVPGRLSWPLAGLLLLADLGIRAALHGFPWTPTWSAVFWTVLAYLDDCFIFFGLVRLVGLVAELQSAREQLAGLAVARERLQAAESLRAAVGERLAAVAALTAAAQRALPADPAGARAQVAAAGVTARDAASRARDVIAGHRAGPGTTTGPGSPASGTTMAPRLAWAILAVLLCGFGLQTLNNVYLSHFGPGGAALIGASTIAGVALQLYHSRRAPAGPVPGWPLTLAVQIALVYLPFVLVPVRFVGGLTAFAAGSILLLVPGRWRWAGYAALAASWTVLYATIPQAGLTPHPGTADVLYIAVAIAGVGLAVYGLSWLAGTARQLAALGGELARMATLRERLRVARDVHDLLGLGLAAIALKTDLIGRLLGRDDTRAGAEIAELGRICAAARADIRLVTEASGPLALDAELATAADILASAGVSVRVDAAAAPRPAAADAVLAPVLREAVTNVLRHSAAASCAIELTAVSGTLRLRVSNDGVPGPAGQRSEQDGGRGLANLAARLHAAGGQLTAGQHGARFELCAALPLPAGLVSRPG